MALAAQVYANALTLGEYAKGLEEGSLNRVLVETFTEKSDVLQAIPIRPAQMGKYRYERTTQLPTVAQRGWNEPGHESTGKFDMGEEGVFLMDEYIKVDRASPDHFGPMRRIRQTRLKAIAMAQNATRVIFNGDTSNDPREANGLKNRFNVAGVSLFTNNAASGGGPLSLVNLDIVRRSVNKPTHWVFPYDLMAYADAAARSPTLTNAMFSQGMDQDLGRVVTKYQGLPILYGYEPEDSPTLLQFNEVGSGGGGAVTASIYCVSFDVTDEKVFLIEQVALDVQDEGLLPGTPQLSTHVKWDWGIATIHPRSGARLTSITKAAIVA